MIFENEEFFETKFYNYYISKSGKVLSLYGKPHLMNGTLDKGGYRRVGLLIEKEGKRVQRCFFVHHIVSETFLGKRNDGYVVDHINGNKEDNSIENLQYITNKENISKAHKNVSPKCKIKSILILDEKEYVFESINKMNKFLGLSRNQYERFSANQKKVKQYGVNCFKQTEEYVFLDIYVLNDQS